MKTAIDISRKQKLISIKKINWRIWIIASVPVVLILSYIFKAAPNLLEVIYSSRINNWMRQFMSLLVSPFSFSVAEIMIYLLIIALVLLIVRWSINLFNPKGKKYILDILCFFAILYSLFMINWGFNYNRPTIDQLTKLDVRDSSMDELVGLTDSLIHRANQLRETLQENELGVMTIAGGYKDVFERAQLGYNILGETIPQLAGNYGKPKPILISEYMMYTGITGIYIPYTSEANVNIQIEDYLLPATALHEMAHQRGFAREDEANYIAYIAGIAHPDADFQYSSVMLALIHSMNALYRSDAALGRTTAMGYSEGVRRDLNYSRILWSQYEGKAEEVATTINNTYLKANGQKDGVASYGQMVDLLLAHYRSANLE